MEMWLGRVSAKDISNINIFFKNTTLSELPMGLLISKVKVEY